MKNLKLYYLFAFLMAGVIFTSCGDDDDDHDHVGENKITITIEEPLANAVISRSECGMVHIHVDFVATEENHEVEVELHPEGNSDDKIIDFDMHAHDKEITFAEDIDLCAYPSGTVFHLEVEACADHDCEEKETAEIEFSIE